MATFGLEGTTFKSKGNHVFAGVPGTNSILFFSTGVPGNDQTWRHSDWKVALPPFNPNGAMFLPRYPEPTASYSPQPCIRSEPQKFAGWYSNSSLDFKRIFVGLAHPFRCLPASKYDHRCPRFDYHTQSCPLPGRRQRRRIVGIAGQTPSLLLGLVLLIINILKIIAFYSFVLGTALG